MKTRLTQAQRPQSRMFSKLDWLKNRVMRFSIDLARGKKCASLCFARDWTSNRLLTPSDRSANLLRVHMSSNYVISMVCPFLDAARFSILNVLAQVLLSPGPRPWHYNHNCSSSLGPIHLPHPLALLPQTPPPPKCLRPRPSSLHTHLRPHQAQLGIPLHGNHVHPK